MGKGGDSSSTVLYLVLCARCIHTLSCEDLEPTSPGTDSPAPHVSTTMRQTRALLFALVAWLQAVHCRELTERNTPPSKDVQHEIKVHGVPSVQLTPQEIKDAFHEPTVIMDELKRLKDLGLTEAVQAVVDGTAKLAAGHKATGDIIDAHYDNFAVAMRGYTFLEISDSQRPEKRPVSQGTVCRGLRQPLCSSPGTSCFNAGLEFMSMATILGLIRL